MEHLEILLPSQVSWEDTAEGVRPEGVLLMEPKTFVDILARETVVPRQVCVARDSKCHSLSGTALPAL